MFPGNVLSTPTPLFSPYLAPGTLPIAPLLSYSRGGIGIQNATSGIDVQDWMLEVVTVGTDSFFYVSAPNTPPVLVIVRTNVTWARLAFDQNMDFFLSYIDITGPAYYWFDPTSHTYQTVLMESGVTYPCCIMDDVRPQATQVGSNDIVLAYIKDNDLCFRLQRERYGTERTLMLNVDSIIANPTLWQIGMNSKYRLQFAIHGNLYQ